LPTATEELPTLLGTSDQISISYADGRLMIWLLPAGGSKGPALALTQYPMEMGNAIDRIFRVEKKELIEFAGENYGGRVAFWPDQEERTSNTLVVFTQGVGVMVHLSKEQLRGFFERLKKLPAYIPVPSD